MNKIYLVIIDLYESEENSIVNICSNRETAEKLMNQYIKNCKASGYESNYHYHIDEVELNDSEDILWDCYRNSYFNHE